MLRRSGGPDPVRQALIACRGHYTAAAVLSGCANLLCLTPTIFMLQVYDRVVPTGGLATLGLLAAITLSAYATLGMFEWLRSRLLLKAGVRLDRVLAEPVLAAVLGRPHVNRVERAEALRNLDTFRQAMSGPVMTVAFDAPWMPIYVLAAFLVSPWIGLVTLFAGAVLMILVLGNERATHAPLAAAAAAASIAYNRQGHIAANAGDVRALGMRRALTATILSDRARASTLQLEAAFAGGRHTSIMRIVRLMMQSLGLALGAWLAIEGKISGGAIFASTLLISRALAPIEQLTQSWSTVTRAREARRHLNILLTDDRTYQPDTVLPAPRGRIALESLAVAPVGATTAVLAGATLTIEPGEVIGIAGLSGAGKSTLLGTIAGAIRPAAGIVRIDGAALDAWDPERLAPYVGYLPQGFTLFAGSVKDNIARFAGALDGDTGQIDEQVIAAAKRVGAHDMIQRLPQGYDTVLGDGGSGLSAGQAQRVALARALFGAPRIVLLDEPYSHLDNEGQVALLGCIQQLRTDGVTVLMTAHQADMLAAADKIMLLGHGRVARFGPINVPTTNVHALQEKRA
ncbi:type I secretion system permease/ATPase [uncultured Sphingomonas sp.]|uniref:type I secretion system permease/ATPase n=1 Tax=uncultured Sphingomonas sp. TaxID=158754 RepID=UPI0025DCBC88|nr:type I secretion system permease/ATPase [uncultured Sphingomonas sp.]